MKHPLHLLALGLLLTACAAPHTIPLNDEQIALAKQQPIVLNPLPADTRENLAVHTRRQKVAAKIITSIMTRSYSSRTESTLPRERMKGASSRDALEKTMREGMADNFEAIQPSQTLHQQLAKHFAASSGDPQTQLAITIKPVTWHLYYSKDDTFTLEYAVDMHLTLPAHNIRRIIPCDRVSDQARTRDEWLADGQRHMRAFAQQSAEACAGELLRELRIADTASETANTAP